MKKYIVDKLLFLLAGIGIMVAIPFFCGPIFTLIFETITVVCWIGLCWRILVFPLDLLRGKEEKTVYFSRQQHFEEYEFFKRSCFEWVFHYGGNQKITLLVPVSIKKENLASMECPKKTYPSKSLTIDFQKF